MTLQDWLGLILTSLSILAIFGVTIRWVIRHYLKDILHELKPNGGSSIKDQVNRLEQEHFRLIEQNIKNEADQTDLNSKIDRLTEMFFNYISRQR